MNKILITIAILSSFLTIPAFADSSSNSSNFQGLNVALGLQLSDYSSKIKMKGASNDGGQTSTVTDNHWSGVADLSYSKSLTNNWLIGVGVTRDLGNSYGGKENFDCNNCYGGPYHDSDKISVRNHFSIYLQPEYALSNNTALFVKVGYHSAAYGISDNHYIFADANPEIYKSQARGIGFGAGLMTFLSDSVFAKVEADAIYYNSMKFVASDNSQASVKLSTISGIVSIGYRFSL